MLIRDSGDIKWGDPHKDLVVGIVSCGNYSALEDSGIGCIRITSVHKWIMQIISPQVLAPQFEMTCLCKLDLNG